ncbi:MAG: hypothetical protein RBU30_11040 [Polyangia bacterium]|jgi:hypothetical protein|nr:hypothetical protein [Polyangia bacterium]
MNERQETSDTAATRRIALFGLLGTLVFGAACLDLYLNGATYHPVPNLKIFYHLILHHDSAALLLQIGILAAALLLCPAPWMQRLLEFIVRHPLRLGGATTSVLALCALLLYHNHPLSMDEYLVRFQAQAFASGRLTGEFPPALLDRLIPHGSTFLLSCPESGLVISKYWPGFSLLLAPFELARVPWLLNPLLFGGSLLLLHKAAREIFPSQPLAPGWAILMALACPQLLITSFSYYTMPAHLFFNLAFSVLLIQPTPGKAALAGVMGAMALVQHEPAPHLLYALPWFAWVAIKPGRVWNILSLVIGYLPLVILITWLTTTLRSHALGGPPLFADPAGAVALLTAAATTEHIVAPSLGIAWVRFLALLKLWAWAMPGLLVLAVMGAARVRRVPILAVFAASMLLTFAASLFFQGSQGHGWGYRHLHYCYPALLLLATAALVGHAPAEPAAPSTHAQSRLLAYVCSVAVMSATICNLQRFSQVQDFVRNHLAQLPRHDPTEASFVFVSSGGFYSTDLVQNHPRLEAPTWYLLSQGAKADEKFMQTVYPKARRVHLGPDGSVWKLVKSGNAIPR